MSAAVGSYLRNNVLGLIAIFIALGAGAYAMGLPKNSVKSKQIKAGAVKRAELADGAVTSVKVADGSLLGADFAAGQLPAGPTGPTGPQGSTGPSTGPAGGDLTGDYPNPSVGPDAITGAEIADGSLRAADVAVVTGTFVDDFPSLAADSCTFVTSPAPVPGVEPGDAVLLGPNGTTATSDNFWSLNKMSFSGAIEESTPAPRVIVRLCNYSGSAIDPPSTTWRYLVFR